MKLARMCTVAVLLACGGKTDRDRVTVDTAMVFTALTAAPDSAAQDSTIPDRFRGQWAGRPAECGRPAESFLRITADSVDYYESRGQVLAVDVMKEREIEVLVEFSGEGQVWRQNRRFQLSEDGQSLTDLTMEGHVVRVRCKG